MKKIEVYSDGSGNTFQSDGAYGWRIVIDGVLHSEGSGYLSSATNNVAELTGAIEGLKAAQIWIHGGGLQQTDVDISLVSDSQLTLGYASGSYSCKAHHLLPLYLEIRRLYKELNATTRWVRGHSGDEHNEACDRLAKTARDGKGKSATD